MAHIGWGRLEDSESYGTLGDSTDDFKPVSKELSMSESYSSYQAAAHGMIFAKQNSKLWDLYDQKALLMMQLRFDGVLGFPGGLLEKGESAVDGINREMHEEIGLDLSKYQFSDGHHILAFVHEAKKLVLHFYMMEVSPEDFISVERSVLQAHEYGIETFGTIRVPLHTMGDGLRGFPAFLSNKFIGNARAELIHGLLVSRIFSEEEMTCALKACKEYMKSE